VMAEYLPLIRNSSTGAQKPASSADSEPQLLYRVRDAAKVLGL
jgi:hypothetical protein